MGRRLLLPPELSEGPFPVALGLRGGLSRSELRSGSLAKPTYGVRSGTAATGLRDLAAATLVALPDHAAFSHWTAARLWGLPVPGIWNLGEPLDVMRPTSATPLRRAGVRGHRGLESRCTRMRRELPLVSGPDTWCDLAASLDLDSLVVLGDALHHLPGGLPPGALEALVDRRRRSRGRLLMLRALPLIRLGSDSPMETRARLLFWRGGLPDPELNAVILHSVEREWLARCDFVWRPQRVAVEFDGEEHRRSARRWRADIQRRENLADDGWRVVTLTAPDIYRNGEATLSRLGRLLLG